MIETRRILCPIDFSAQSRHALDHAVAVARWYGSSITVLHVFSTTPVAAYAPGFPVFAPVVLSPADRQEILGHIREFARTEAAPGVAMEAMLREGDAVGEILAQAVEMQADLLVAGTHGHSGFERLVLGSVTEKLLRKAECPVLAVPPAVPDAVPAAPVVFKRILCAVDFSESSLRGLEYAISLAREADAHLTVLHVTAYDMEEAPTLHETSVGGRQMSMEEIQARSEKGLRQRLEETIPPDTRTYCTVDTVVASGTPYQMILRTADEDRSELIVMGIQGRGALKRMFMGSTANHIVRQAACPVLTLRAPAARAQGAGGGSPHEP